MQNCNNRVMISFMGRRVMRDPNKEWGSTYIVHVWKIYDNSGKKNQYLKTPEYRDRDMARNMLAGGMTVRDVEAFFGL